MRQTATRRRAARSAGAGATVEAGIDRYSTSN
jgi:hypothetical protein